MAPERLVQTSEWDGMPGHPVVETTEFIDLGDGRTRVISTSFFMTGEERDAAMRSGLTEGVDDSYAALDALLARLPD
jgi:uncharacterized protein YndB with AHSA1/START domain